AGGPGGPGRVARGQAVGSAGQRGPAPTAAVHPGVAAGRALLAAGPGGGGQPDDRADRPAAGDPPDSARGPGSQPGAGPSGRRVPLGQTARTVTNQQDSVSTVRLVLWYAQSIAARHLISLSLPWSEMSLRTRSIGIP